MLQQQREAIKVDGDEQYWLLIYQQWFQYLVIGKFLLTNPPQQVDSLKNDSKSKLAQHCAEVYHKALDIVFDDIKTAAKHGIVIKILGRYRKGMPIFMTVSADYEEMQV